VNSVFVRLVYDIKMYTYLHSGETPLHLAARYQRADATKKLLDAGADPKARDNSGRTPLHAAVAADARGVFQVKVAV
jgi:ankyrin repeat protein